VPSLFDAYDYIGYIAPGATMLLCLAYLFPWIREQLGTGESAATEIGAFVLIAFVLGHILHQLGHFIVGSHEYPTATVACKNSELPEEKRLLSQAERDKIFEYIQGEFPELKESLKEPCFIIATNEMGWHAVVKEWRGAMDDICKMLRRVLGRDSIDSMEEKRRVWRDVVERIYIKLRGTKTAERVDIFNRIVGLTLALSTAFVLLTAVVYGFILLRVFGCASKVSSPLNKVSSPQQVSGPPDLIKAGFVLVLLALGSVAAIDRMRYFEALYARELFLTYLSQWSPNVL